MKKLEYYHSLSDDIKKSKKKNNFFRKYFVFFDIGYVLVLLAYLVVILTGAIDGVYRSDMTLCANSLIIIRSSIYLYQTRTRYKLNEAFDRISSLIYRIKLTEAENNNLPSQISSNDIVDSIQVVSEKTQKKYNDEDTLVLNTKQQVIDYYFLDSNNKLKVLRELKEYISKYYTASELYLLEDEEIEEMDLPVKQVLELKK